MKVIDLLNKIAKGEEVPKKIKRHSTVYTYYEGIDYKNVDGEYLMGNSVCISYNDLNYELEIIEEDKEIEEIEEISFNNGMKDFIDVYHELEHYNYKINEIIRVVNELKKGNK